KKTSQIKAKAFAPDWTGSLTVSNSLFKSGIKPKSYTLAFEPNKKYAAKGAASLFDGIKGKTGHGSGNWLGFTDTPLELEILLEADTSPNELSLSILLNEIAYL